MIEVECRKLEHNTCQWNIFFERDLEFLLFSHGPASPI